MEDVRETINSATVKQLKAMAKGYANQLTMNLIDEGTFADEIEEIKQITGQKVNDRIIIPTSLTKAKLRYATYNLYQRLEGMADIEDSHKKARNTFMERHKDADGNPIITREQWEKVVDVLGAMGEKMLQQYGSNQIVEDFATYVANNNLTEIELIGAIQKAIDDPSMKGKTQSEVARKAHDYIHELMLNK